MTAFSNEFKPGDEQAVTGLFAPFTLTDEAEARLNQARAMATRA